MLLLAVIQITLCHIHAAVDTPLHLGCKHEMKDLSTLSKTKMSVDSRVKLCTGVFVRNLLPAGYGRGVPGYPRYTYEGDRSKGEHNLLIKSATSQDDGEYQCQVGPVPGMVSKIASANVTVLVPPGSISVAGRREETELEVTAGDPLTLECLVRDARPAPSVAWYRSGLKVDPALHKEEVLASGGEEEGRWNVKSRLVIRPTRDDDGRQFSCRALHPALEHSPANLVVSVVLDVLRRWNVKSRLVIRSSRDDDGRQFSCRALHPALEHSPANLVVSVVLDVLHAPSPPTISGYTTGEILVLGDERTLSCEVIGGNPRPRVVWYRHGRPLKTVQASSKRRVGRTKAAESRDEGVITVTQDVTATRREDGAMYECRVSNALLAQPLSSNVTLTVHYPPEGVTLSTPAVVGVDQRFSARCVTSPARPPAVITWMIQGILTTNVPSDVIEGEEGGWVTTSDLTSEYVNLENVSEVGLACRAHNPASDWVVSESSSITITRPPGRPLLKLEILEGNKNALETVAARGQVSEGPQTVEPQQVVKPKHVVAGMTLRATCISVGGNPPPTITIYKRQERMKVTLNQTEAATQGQTRFRVREADNGAEILCEVTNPATPAPLTTLTPIDVKFPPREVSGWVKPMNVEAGEEAALSCHTTPSRPRSTITWYSRAGVLQATSTVHSQAVFGGTITRSELTIRATADDNGRVVTCVAQNGLGSSVNVNITVSVLHGPVWVKVPSGRLDFLEGGDLVLTAVAAANPPTVSYSWWRGPEMIIGEGISEDGTGALRLNRIHRNQQGNYSVSAHTSRGTAHSDFFINVQFKAFGAIKVKCDVHGC
ncbi:nephrin-like [Penaeus vannamei]|uniref:nephrin-like n=1 Tax=Penaeus vannamei TaxID=6689 RepID=UPI00387F90DC